MSASYQTTWGLLLLNSCPTEVNCSFWSIDFLLVLVQIPMPTAPHGSTDFKSRCFDIDGFRLKQVSSCGRQEDTFYLTRVWDSMWNNTCITMIETINGWLKPVRADCCSWNRTRHDEPAAAMWTSSDCQVSLHVCLYSTSLLLHINKRQGFPGNIWFSPWQLHEDLQPTIIEVKYTCVSIGGLHMNLMPEFNLTDQLTSRVHL